MNYRKHFGLQKAPFATTPDPAFAYSTKTHLTALSKIGYSVEEGRGIFVLTGPVGTGKTTILWLLMNDLKERADEFKVGYVVDPSPRTPAAFLRLVLGSFGVAAPYKFVDIQATLRNFLITEFHAKRKVVLLLDEAQTISAPNLGTLQSLSNEQSATDKLIQIVLFAQPSWDHKVTHHKALASRIASAYTLNTLTLEDTLDMLRHRLAVAGGDFDVIFPVATHRALYNVTNGVPRDLCVLSDEAMVQAFIQGSKTVSEAHIESALKDLSFKGWSSK